MNNLKSCSLDEATDEFIGKRGTEKRESFEKELRLDLMGEAIKQARKERKLTQEELGKLVGVQKAQISKLERSAKNVTIGTILKVFEALQANLKFSVELRNSKINL